MVVVEGFWESSERKALTRASEVLLFTEKY